jgi:hypothetical protein
MLTGPAATFVNCINPCRRVIFEKLTVPQLVRKFPAFYGTLHFNTGLERTQHLSLP